MGYHNPCSLDGAESKGKHCREDGSLRTYRTVTGDEERMGFISRGKGDDIHGKVYGVV